MLNTHCSHCGIELGPMETSARQCSGCHEWTYKNPPAVVCTLLRVATGYADDLDDENGYKYANKVLLIRRNIEPGLGKLALPGGFVDFGETWQEASARELFEETGIKTDPAEHTIYDVVSTDRNILLFTWTPRLEMDVRAIKFVSNSEVTELVYVDEPVELAFPAHTLVLENFLRDQLDY